MQALTRFNDFIDSHSEDKTQAKAMKLSVLGTGIVWLLMLITLAVSPMFHKPEHFQTVKITLEPLSEQRPEPREKANPALSKVDNATEKEAAAPKKQEVKKTEAPKAVEQPKKAEQKKAEPQKTVEKVQPKPVETKSAQQPVQKTVQKTVPPKTVEQPKPTASAPKATQTTQPQTQTKSASTPAKEVQTEKKVEQPLKKADIKYKKSLDEIMEEQMSSSNKPAAWDDSRFDDAVENSNATQTQNNQVARAIDNSSALTGTAASSDSTTNNPVSAQSSTQTKSVAATEGTSSRLSNIANIVPQEFSEQGGNGLSSTSKVSAAKASDGRLSLSLSDGSARVLLEPKEPKIKISEENGKLIDSSRNVVITFKILASGNVPFNGISITPASALPLAIQSEIKEQVSKWRFAPSSSDGVARFEYSIIKR